MSRIIKSMAVVEAQPAQQRPQVPHNLLDSNPRLGVIKSYALAGQPGSRVSTAPADKQSWLDELNRLKVEVNDVKTELRSLSREVEEEKQRLEEARKRRRILEDLQGLDVGEHVREMIEEAEAEAEAILQLAREQAQGVADEMKSQGYLDGLEQGASEARIQFQNEQEGNVRKLIGLMESLSGMKESMARENEAEIVKLILAIAEKIIGKTLKEDPEAVVDMMRQTLEDNRREAYIKIVISSDLIPAEAKVSEQVKTMMMNLGEQIDVYVDGDAPAKSIVVETPKGYIDLAVSGQLENIHEAMLEES